MLYTASAQDVEYFNINKNKKIDAWKHKFHFSTGMNNPTGYISLGYEYRIKHKLCLIVGRPCNHQTFVLTTDNKLPTLHKIKRAVSRHTIQRFCSTTCPAKAGFNFVQQHHRLPVLQTTD
jgi:hypothetical protein